MSDLCNPALGNLGQACELNDMSEIKRILFVSQTDANGDANKILKTDLLAIAGLQAKFDIPNFDADVLTKLVSSMLLYDVASTQADANAYDQGGYYKKTSDGNYDISFTVNEAIAKQIGLLKDFENNNIAVFFVDADTRVIGRDGRLIGDDLYLYPVSMQNINIPNFNLPSYAGISQEICTARVLTPSDMNTLISIQIADANVASDSDFYSLTDVNTVISAPATTGCVAVLSEVIDGSAVAGFVFGDFNFYDVLAPTVAIPLAGAGSLVEAPDGTYTINEVALLASGSYTLEIIKSKYDVQVGVVIVP
ncbi:MAG: hypothetical protein QNK20_16530 [Aureibaculum sp.]|nr:hypothetical protein [Aureibaculum sp.]